MEADCIPFKNTGYFSKIIIDYLEGSEKLRPFFSLPPKLDSFESAMNSKEFSDEQRITLVNALQRQYSHGKIKLNDSDTATNINLLNDINSFTITTGHQLCLFTGPLYFIYKIVSVIKLCQELSENYPNKRFVPVYWMATEDHDFEEISFFKSESKKYKWLTEQTGAVGRMTTSELELIYEEFKSDLPELSAHANELKVMFEKAYLRHNNLADATRYLVHELFKEHGLVIIDGDDPELKRQFSPIVKQELLSEFSSEKVSEQSELLAKNYKVQVNPREINLFYLKDDQRKRIVKENGSFFINETDKQFSEKAILTELSNYPERFSPNVLLRPIYQEAILPNLAYIGGGGELAYWFQLKKSFEHVEIPMPILVLRNSVAWMNAQQAKTFKKLGLTVEELFMREGDLLKHWVNKNSQHDLELKDALDSNENVFNSILDINNASNAGLKDHIEALSTKFEKALTKLSEKLIREERKKSVKAEERINFLKQSLFVNNGLQERSLNFTEIYLTHGKQMIPLLMSEFNVLADEFLLLKDS